MKFKLPRQLVSRELSLFGSKQIKIHDHYVPKAGKNILKDVALISREIRKHGLPKHLVWRKLKGKLGYGIFLHPDADPIEKGTAIAPYSGEVYIVPQNQGENSDYTFALISDLRLSREEQRIWDPKRRYHPRRVYSIDLDAYKKGNFTRFINHSEKPNLEAVFLRIPSNSVGLAPSPFELIYITKKRILPGEQLLVCYEASDKSYWGAMNIKPFPMTARTFMLDDKLRVVHKKSNR